VKHGVVVGVREACMRLTLRAIRLGEIGKLKPTKTRVTTTAVAGVREAHMRLSLRAVRRGEFTLKACKTRESRGVVVVVAPRKLKAKLASIVPTVPVQLNHVQPRVTTTPVVGVKDAVMRLALRSIRLGEFELKAVRAARETHDIVVREAAATKTNNAAIMRRHAALLSTLANAGPDAFEAVRVFGALDDKSRALVIELLEM